MPRDRFKPKDFDDYRSKDGPSIEKANERLSSERPEKYEGDYYRNEKDVDDDYFRDKERSEEDRGELPAPKPRALKRGKKLIKRYPTRYKRRTSRR